MASVMSVGSMVRMRAPAWMRSPSFTSKLDHAPADFGREAHVGGFDVARGAEAIGILGLLTGGGERRERRRDGQGGATG